MRDRKRPLPDAAGKLIADTLDRILGDLHMGRAEVSGGRSIEGEKGYLELSLSVSIKGDGEQGARVVRDVLWWSGAPASVKATRIGQAEVALDLGRNDHEAGEAYLQLSKIRTVQWSDGHRFDRVAFPKSCRTALKAVLAQAGATGPDEDGWFSVSLADGGSMGLCLRRLDEDHRLDGATVHLRRLSVDVSGLLFALLSKAELLLLPMVIAASHQEAEAISAPWPRVRIVETAGDLYDIIQRGAFDWWFNRRDIL
jgi:hypothetical protein